LRRAQTAFLAVYSTQYNIVNIKYILLYIIGKYPEIWILGDSIVRRLEDEKYGSIYEGTVNMKGQGGGKMECVQSLLVPMMRDFKDPDVLVVHIGTNNLADTTKEECRKEIDKLLFFLLKRFPETVLVWSDILPRSTFRKSKCMQKNNPKALDKKRLSINSYAHRVFLRNGCDFITYPSMKKEFAKFFLRDGIHLNNKGMSYFFDIIMQKCKQL
jgi:hypothetical protein